ncbi:hypothetical protein COLU111180_19990 [Cohnella lubricantis]|uniref:DUF2157 domain-containing protein n=1 Tax=Cohnella lubricantis TaxID=2163172 RepID=A0A841TIH0_9BACL|nr:hypothetical protein [Cohnella lubricantis]MBB6678727.1 hypothetical protein [Cohnella lubricantis]MBP2119795.1 hypothetical protein [Cohnella lubricantis]
MPVSEDEKKKLIVKEIESWQRGKMLPDQYCNFLLNLYLDDLSDRPKNAVGAAMRKIGKATGKQWFLSFGIFVLICLVVLHFSVFPLVLQIGLIGLGTAGFIAAGVRWRADLPHRAYLFIGSGMLLLPGAGIAVLRLHGWESGAGPMVLLMVCAIVWIACGIAVRFGVLHWFGWLAIIALYAITLAKRASDPSALEVQIFWLPASLLFAWLSWFIHVKLRSAGTVLFATALILWFMPEIYAALLHMDEQQIQIGLLIKTALLGFGLYRFRKQWMEWVVGS